jgi:hypothetical protein
MLTNRDFLIGVAVGVLATWAYHRYAGAAMGAAPKGKRQAQA